MHDPISLLSSLVAAALLVGGCQTGPSPDALRPSVVTERVVGDPDDPAIWVDPENPSASLILGTDKSGWLYVFDLQGNIDKERTIGGLGRMNNVDVEYGLELGGRKVDIAVATDATHRTLRIFRLPDMTPIDGGGLPVFEGEEGDRGRPMGVALYRRPEDGAVFAMVSRKRAVPAGNLWQYRLEPRGEDRLVATKVRELGRWSGRGEIESIAVDDALGYLYYSDESAGVRKYHADPNRPDAGRELAFFGTEGFRRDREGISIYSRTEKTGYILVNDQDGYLVHVFKREGEKDDPHRHTLVAKLPLAALESDGCEATSIPLGPGFDTGLFVAMSDDRTFHLYSWDELVQAGSLSALRLHPLALRLAQAIAVRETSENG